MNLPVVDVRRVAVDDAVENSSAVVKNMGPLSQQQRRAVVCHQADFSSRHAHDEQRLVANYILVQVDVVVDKTAARKNIQPVAA